MLGAGAAFIGGDALYDVERFAVAAGGAAEGAYVTYARTGEGGKDADWKRRYDATMVLLSAVEKAAAKQPDGSLAIGRKALAEALRSMNYDGVTGKIAFDDKGDRTGTMVVVNKVVKGKFEEVR